MLKNLPASAGDTGSIPDPGRSPWRRKWQPTEVFLPGRSHGQRSLVGYSPWGHKRVRQNCGTKQQQQQQQQQGIKRGHLSQFWLRHQRLMQLTPRIPATRSCGSGQVTSAGLATRLKSALSPLEITHSNL